MNSWDHSRNEKNAISFLPEHGLLALLAFKDMHRTRKEGLHRSVSLQIICSTMTKTVCHASALKQLMFPLIR